MLRWGTKNACIYLIFTKQNTNKKTGRITRNYWLPKKHGQEWGRSDREEKRVESKLQAYLCLNFAFRILRVLYIHK